MATKMRKRFYEMIAEDARIVAAEWREMGLEDAGAMLGMTREATRKGEILPEPAEQAKQRLRDYLPRNEVALAWPEMLKRIDIELRLGD
jgi:uncharacterized protein YheU (UPF0270 family)